MAWFEGGGYEGSDGDRQFAEALGDEDARRWDLDYALRKQGLDQQYSIAKLNARTASERNAIDKWYNQEQIKLARDRLAFDRESFQAKLGYDVLNTAANMRGADDYFQASNYMRGVANNPNSATFLNALRNNIQMPGFVAPSGSPDAFTMGSLSAKLGTPLGDGGAGAPGATDNATAYLNQIHALGAAGAHKLGAGALEQLSSDELGLLKSGLEAPDANGKAFNFSDFLKQYRSSRIGQGLAGSAAA